MVCPDIVSDRMKAPAAVLACTNKMQQAEPILVTLLAVESKSVAVRVRYELGRICYRRGEYEKAAGYHQDALDSIFSEPRSSDLDAALTH